MFCKKCGEELKQGAQFCPKCGTKIEALEEKKETLNKLEKEGNIEKKPRKKRKWIIISILIIVLLGIGISAFLFMREKEIDGQYEEKIMQARELTEQEKYEDAIKIYKDAITIRAKRDTAYLEMANIYEIQGEPEKALEILKEAEEKTESAAVTEQLTTVEKVVEEIEEQEKKELMYQKLYEDYMNDTILPTYGTAEGGEMSVNWTQSAPGAQGTGISSVSKPEAALGVVATKQEDLDMDGIPELIVLRVAEEEPDLALYTGFLYVHIYSIRDDAVIELQQPQRMMRYRTLHVTESGNLNVFIKENNGEKYLCVFNCVRSKMIQLRYVSYVDAFQIEGENIVCRKSVSIEGSYIFDTTNVPVGEAYSKPDSERNIIYEVERQSIMYAGLTEHVREEFRPYFDLGENWGKDFTEDVLESTKFWGSFSGSSSSQKERDPLKPPYDFPMSELSEYTKDLFRLRGVCDDTNTEITQYWEYFDYTGEDTTKSETTKESGE